MSEYYYYQENNPNQQNQDCRPPAPPTEEKASAGLAILSFLIPIAGLIIFLVDRDKKPKTAKASGICALISFILSILFSVIMSVAGSAFLFGAVDDTVKDIGSSSSDVQADGGNAEKNDSRLGNYECTVKGASLCKSWEGKDAVAISYDFTNNSSESMSFDIALNASAYQNGVALEESFLSDDDDTGFLDVKIKPGVTKEVKKIYKLRDKTTPIEVEIQESFSLNDDKITTTVKLK